MRDLARSSSRILSFAALVALACGGSEETEGDGNGGGVCTPKEIVECPCPSGALGAKICADDGTAFGECICGTAPTGCTAAPDCGSCQACYDQCLCNGGDSMGCLTACNTGTGGAGGDAGAGVGGGPGGVGPGGAGPGGAAPGGAGGAGTGGAGGGFGGGPGGTGGGATGGTGGSGASGGSGGTGATGGSGGTGASGGSGGSGATGMGGTAGLSSNSGEANCYDGSGTGVLTTCDLTTEKCCVLDPNAADACIAAADPCECQPGDPGCDFAIEVTCDGPEDCAMGEQCCGIWNGMVYTETRCQTQCDFQGGGTQPSELVMCHQGVAQCPTGQTCSQSPSLPPYLQRCL